MPQSTMKVGFSRVRITPPMGAPMAGYYQSRKAKGILDELYANGVAFDNGEKRVVMISADLLFIIDEYANAFRKKISEELDLPLESVFIATTHTHTGPLLGKNSAGDHDIPAYVEYLGYLLRDCAKLALDDVKEAKLSYAVGEAKNISFVRRYFMKDGTVKTNPGINNPDIIGPAAQPHEGVYLLKAVREEADDIYIVSFGTHADTIGGEYLSADWPGFVRSTLERALDNVKCAFFTGFEGDVNHIDVNPFEGDLYIRKGYECAKHMGRTVAGAVLQVCGRTTPVTGNEIAFGSKIITVPSHQENDKLEDAKRVRAWYKSPEGAMAGMGAVPLADCAVKTVPEAMRIISLENGPDNFDYLLSAIRIGNIGFGGIAGEPFTEIGDRIRADSKYDMTMLYCCANGGSTYFPTSKAYDEGGYEAEASKLRKGADNIIVSGLTELLNSL